MTKQIKPLEQQIEEYKNSPEFTRKTIKYDWRTKLYLESYRWSWDDAWDGQLIRDVISLEQYGFIVTSFSRKRKVTLKHLDKSLDRWELVKLIEKSVGNSWYSISFKPTLSIYWKGRSSKWNY